MRVPRKIFSTLHVQRDSFWFSVLTVAQQGTVRRGREKRSMKRRAGAFVSNHYYRYYVRYLRAIRTSLPVGTSPRAFSRHSPRLAPRATPECGGDGGRRRRGARALGAVELVQV